MWRTTSNRPGQYSRIVERCFAWLGRNRRFAKDFEATIASATTFLYAASVLLLTRRLARSA
jgi:putative transposase